MRVCLNALHFVPGKMGGVETYLRELIRTMPLVGGAEDSIVIYTNSKYLEAFSTNTIIPIEHAKIYERPDPRWLVRAVLRKSIGIDLYATALSKIKADILHYPFTVMAPLVTNKPTVLTFWDMQHEFYPEFFSKKEIGYRAAVYRKSVQKATRIIVSSAFTKRCLTERYGVDAAKIDVVYTGYAPDFQVMGDAEDVIRCHGVERPFMYYPAATWPHKNHALLLDALRLLIDRWGFDGILVLSGISMQQDSAILERIRTLALENYVKILGYLPYSELPYFYNAARLMVFPSLFEGFGIPLVEAMACGCPVVAADCTSIPEVVGSAGRLFDPGSAEALAENIWSLWNNDTELQAMSEKGLQRAACFTWRETALATLQAYRKLL
ncbi:glycosyltransferase family 1 protein [Geobacter sp. SVR]|uniref:glycosyltransferase family 4 protein n=1 Tax=Geobacter sp. SVR TaxID=2495594 RepID=UPI00143EF55C|nr:glycosyltransferase family 1 protein [Geobacter sp. SVR]BCS51979.1 glycosyl transferase family 1 [Geobacter sp. SVR]GCF87206.1 hypothetical protein GSbR_38060 [Geobacter sp. SVR]